MTRQAGKTIPEDGIFAIPKDAQKGLIYIGLDENFEPVTGLFTSEGEN